MGSGSICPRQGNNLLSRFSASARFSFQTALERGWLRKRSIFSKYSRETTAAHNLQCKVRASTKTQPKQIWGQRDVLAAVAGRRRRAGWRGAARRLALVTDFFGAIKPSRSKS